jgi:competence protein ComEA
MNIRDTIAVMLSMTRTEVTVVSFLLLSFVLGVIVDGSRSFQEAALFEAKEKAGYFTDADVDSLLREAMLLEKSLSEKGKLADHIGLSQKLTVADTAGSRKIVFSDATADELSSIPGISGVLANRLITFRKSKQERVERFHDFLEVKGIGKRRMETLKQHLILD